MQRNHGDELYAWYADDAQDPWVTTWECHDEDPGEWTAWFGDTTSWDEASTPADAYKERLAQQNLEGDCEQIAMEMQSAYLSNEDQHAYLGKGKSKGYGKGKKGMSKGMKGKGYGKSKR